MAIMTIVDGKIFTITQISEPLKGYGPALNVTIPQEARGENMKADDRPENEIHLCPKCHGHKQIQDTGPGGYGVCARYIDCPPCNGTGYIEVKRTNPFIFPPLSEEEKAEVELVRKSLADMKLNGTTPWEDVKRNLKL